MGERIVEHALQPMYVRLPVDLHAAVKARAAADDRTMAQTIRQALRFYLAQTSPIAVTPATEGEER